MNMRPSIRAYRGSPGQENCMWHLCSPTYEDPGAAHEFWMVTDWTVRGVGEVGSNGPLESISVRGPSVLPVRPDIGGA